MKGLSSPRMAPRAGAALPVWFHRFIPGRHREVVLEEPLRAELLNTEQMQQHGGVLAETHRTSQKRGRGDRLLGRLVDNEIVLSSVQEQLVEAALAQRRIVPAADWLLDNFYLIEQHVRTSKRDLPKGYSRGLPRLTSGPAAGLPRVYDIALELISHGDGMVDPLIMTGYIESYQSKAPLTLGELWALPIMLRLAPGSWWNCRPRRKPAPGQTG